MDVRQIEMFLAVVDEGGFNKAASKLYVSQSAISRRIMLLEEEFGDKFFVRTHNRLLLTPAGKAMVTHGRAILNAIRAATTEVSSVAGLMGGTLILAAPMTACIYTLPNILRKLREKFPGITLRIITGTTTELLQKIETGQADLGFLTLPIANNGVQVTKLWAEELVVVVGPGHAWWGRDYIEARDLAERPLITFEHTSTLRQNLEEIFRELGVAPQVIMELPNPVVIKPLVEINLGISILPFVSVADEIKANRLHALRLRGHKLERTLGLVVLKSPTISNALREVIQFIQTLPT